MLIGLVGSYIRIPIIKTELIYDLVNANNAVTLFTRPRRFGKTLTLSMMESFFDISKDSVDVFSDLAIMSHPEFCSQWMNQYPVIFISLKDVEGLDFDRAYGMLRYKISDLCIKLDAQIKQDSVNPDDWIRFCKLKSTRVDIEEVKNSLFMLTRMMSSVYSKPVILLIDEYDVPLAKAQENGYYREMLDTVRGMFSVALKTNDYLKFAVVTGCLRI